MISNFSKSRHLASYVSRHNAMAYDTPPPQMKLSDVKIVQKNLDTEKKLTVMIQEVMENVRIVLLSKKRKILWE